MAVGAPELAGTELAAAAGARVCSGSALGCTTGAWRWATASWECAKHGDTLGFEPAWLWHVDGVTGGAECSGSVEMAARGRNRGVKEGG